MSGAAPARENGIDGLLERSVILPGRYRITIGTLVAAVLLVVAVALRVAWSLLRDGPGASGEAFNVAQALADGRGFADSYRVGQGPTAHLLPVSPLVAGAVYRLLGVNTAAAEAVLVAWAVLLMAGSYVLLFRLFGQLGLSRWARLGALAYLCLSPVYIAQESVDFRIWEGGLAVFLGVALVASIVSAERATSVSTRRIVGVAVLAAGLFIVNPIVGLAGYAGTLILAIRRLPLRRFLLAGAIATAALAAVIVPWTLRNAVEMGAFIPLRSNSGLELAIGQNPHALGAADQGAAFVARMGEVHPAIGNEPYARLRALGGEVRYSEALGRETRTWIAAHPGSAARLALRHVRQTFAPEPWQFGGFLPEMRSVLAGLVGVLGLAGLALAVMRRRPLWTYVALMVLVPAFVLAPFQPVPRYTYLFYPWLTFCAAYLVDRAMAVRRPNGAGRPVVS